MRDTIPTAPGELITTTRVRHSMSLAQCLHPPTPLPAMTVAYFMFSYALAHANTVDTSAMSTCATCSPERQNLRSYQLCSTNGDVMRVSTLRATELANDSCFNAGTIQMYMFGLDSVQNVVALMFNQTCWLQGTCIVDGGVNHWGWGECGRRHRRYPVFRSLSALKSMTPITLLSST